MRTLFWGDLHLFDPKVAAIRGYASVADHNEAVMAPIRALGKRDTLVIAGDAVGRSTDWAAAVDLLAACTCTVVIVSGNHDPSHPMHRHHAKATRYALDAGIKSVTPFLLASVSGRKVPVSHFPYSDQGSHPLLSGPIVSVVPEGPEWRESPTHTGYFADALGRVRGRHGRVLKSWLAGSGYHYTAVPTGGTKKKNVTVHSVVCEAFHGPRPPGLEVAHGNGVRTDNRASNLRWATHAENKADMLAHGTGLGMAYSRPGDDNGNAKLDEDKVRLIRSSSLSARELANAFGVRPPAIYDILKGKTWRHTLSGDHTPTDRHVQWRLRDEGAWLICGHVHHAWKFNGRQINVGVDQWVKPVSGDVLAAHMDAAETQRERWLADPMSASVARHAQTTPN